VAQDDGRLFDGEGRDFDGTVEIIRQIFVAEEDGFAIIEARDQSGGEMVLTGSLAHLSPGERARVSGDWEHHEKFGPQLRAAVALPLDPEDREGQVAFLGTLSHIGPVRAEALCEMYGAEVLETIAADPVGAFSALPRMSLKQAEAAAGSWTESRAVRDLYVQLAPLGLAHLAHRIHSRFGDRAMEVIRTDPYALTEVEGVGFKRADAIALEAGVPPESDRRAQAATLYLLSEAEKKGHTHLPLEALAGGLEPLLGRVPDEGVIIAGPGLAVDGERLYRQVTLDRERWCATDLAERTGEPAWLDLEPEPPEGTDLTGEQWKAVEGAFSARVSVITGGPGVGKTVCTREVVGAAKEAGLRVLLAAPTGRAARRMSEATGVEAFTVHRLLEWRPGSEPGFGPDRTLPADLIVVDEASMINLRMFEVLLGGVAHETHLVLVGDADQLPPVGAGKPFSDLIESGLVPTTRLTHIFRQAARSMIITAAHQVNAGAPPSFEPEADQETDLFFLDRPSADQVADSVVDLVGDRVSAGLGLDPARDAQVLVPVYRGEAGIDALNERLQARLNPAGRPAFEGRFRLGDRLIQTRNAHEIGLMNGTICFLVGDDPEEGSLVLETDDGETVVLPYEEARDLRLAYAISVHKSQGCEIPVVVFVCQRAHTGMLTRPLIYTAITRARKMCVVVGDRLSLDRGVRRDDGGRRYSSLPERLKAGAS
jgi:exodeoxyribonuclease V alpha subunit